MVIAGASSVAATAASKAKVGAAAGVAKVLYMARGAVRFVAHAASKAKVAVVAKVLYMARGAVGFVAGAAYIWHKKGKAFVKYLLSPVTPTAHPHESRQRAQGQMMEWMATRRRSTSEHRRLARAI